VHSSLLLLGTVNGAVHATGLEHCVLVVRARQLRMHECRQCVVYADVASGPIVEDCAGMAFAPAPPPAHHAVAAAAATAAAAVTADGGGAAPPNQWDKVQDFKWLRSEPSPNWSVLPQEERLGEEVWRGVVPGGGKGKGVGDILQAVGVKTERRDSLVGKESGIVVQGEEGGDRVVDGVGEMSI
jgi:hypothetical protein